MLLSKFLYVFVFHLQIVDVKNQNFSPCCSMHMSFMFLGFQISKDEFNKVAKELLGEANIHVHNEFVLALLLKCQQTHRGFRKGMVF